MNHKRYQSGKHKFINQVHRNLYTNNIENAIL